MTQEKMIGDILVIANFIKDRTEERFDKIEQKIDDIEGRLDGVENKMDGVEKN
jgi:tetrahydromethanopterin S-methyltransferase subunit G